MIDGLFAVLANLFFGGPVHKPAKALPEMLTMPVIFGNGRDDDTEGLRAYIENRPVIWRGDIIPPGDCTLHVETLRLSVCSVWFVANGKLVGHMGFPVPGKPVLTCSIAHGCKRGIQGSEIHFGCEVEP